MSPQEVKQNYGATHYATMADGTTPCLYYKQELVKYNNGTSALRWVYLSFAKIWMGSVATAEELAELKEI